jgi:hypothetical protein
LLIVAVIGWSRNHLKMQIKTPAQGLAFWLSHNRDYASAFNAAS